MRSSLLIIIIIFFCFSCTDRQSSTTNKVKSSIDTVSHSDTISKKLGSDNILDTFILHPTGYKDISAFVDTSINKIRLNDCDTIEKLFGNSYQLLPDMDDLPSIQILNDKESQLLTMYMWNGSSKCDFSQFQIEYAPSKIKYLQKPFILQIGDFKSGKGVYLGITPSQLKSRFGKPNETKQENGLVVFSYQQHNDLYFADYYFKDGKLVKFRYGYEYP